MVLRKLIFHHLNWIIAVSDYFFASSTGVLISSFLDIFSFSSDFSISLKLLSFNGGFSVSSTLEFSGSNFSLEMESFMDCSEQSAAPFILLLDALESLLSSELLILELVALAPFLFLLVLLPPYAPVAISHPASSVEFLLSFIASYSLSLIIFISSISFLPDLVSCFAEAASSFASTILLF